MYKIMIVEDDETIRTELQLMLKNALYESVAATEFTDLPEQIKKESPDLVLLDINLPDQSGLSVCRKLRQFSDVPVIFVTSKNTSMDELECITSGGDDYVSKPYQAPILLARIAAVLKRTGKKNEQEVTAITYKDVTLDLLACTVSYEGKESELSKNEFRILTYLFSHTGQVVSRMDLIEYLWDNQVFIDDNTLSVNMTRLRGKLADIGVADLIETKRGLGYKL
ncbi:response regulator transcription factor [Anaerovorax odorimutans]|uniref:Stage 0 sporulation protein A homolog n=1 Tax=Anaerovorax odorimutans TaxID=109327 RepID=A0ABT1RS19_9FIRM|nr:response regulator transcription factor [Anaerovorax odorimutans]MCQ4637973.1 response regulator transcription factor [Anaerovorax odorimutans]